MLSASAGRVGLPDLPPLHPDVHAVPADAGPTGRARAAAPGGSQSGTGLSPHGLGLHGCTSSQKKVSRVAAASPVCSLFSTVTLTFNPCFSAQVGPKPTRMLTGFVIWRLQKRHRWLAMFFSPLTNHFSSTTFCWVETEKDAVIVVCRSSNPLTQIFVDSASTLSISMVDRKS